MTLRKQIVILGSVLALGAALGIIPREAQSGGDGRAPVHQGPVGGPAGNAPDQPAQALADSI